MRPDEEKTCTAGCTPEPPLPPDEVHHQDGDKKWVNGFFKGSYYLRGGERGALGAYGTLEGQGWAVATQAGP